MPRPILLPCQTVFSPPLSTKEQVNLTIIQSTVNTLSKKMGLSKEIAVYADPDLRKGINASSNTFEGHSGIMVSRFIINSYMNESKEKRDLVKLINECPDSPKLLSIYIQNLDKPTKDRLALNIQSLSDEEIDYILAHELSHIKHEHSDKFRKFLYLKKQFDLIGIIGLLALTALDYGINNFQNRSLYGSLAFGLAILSYLAPNVLTRKFEFEADQSGRLDENFTLSGIRYFKRCLIFERLFNQEETYSYLRTHPSDAERLKAVLLDKKRA